MTDIIVIGGGAAGCMAAIMAARNGCTVAILDHNTTILKKILATGNGKCNFTNQEQGSGFYYCNDPAFVLHVLDAFSAQDTIDFFESIGVYHKNKNGYCYPITDQAATVRSSLLSEMKRLNIQVHTDIGIRSVKKKDSVFYIDTKQGIYSCKACILATGGKASPKSGSDGTGYVYARKLGHTISPPLPALTALCGTSIYGSSFAGVRCDGQVTVLINGVETASDQGELQWTDYGISGIPVFQVSRFVSIGLKQGMEVTLDIDLFPNLSSDLLHDRLVHSLERYQNIKTWNELLYGMVNTKIADGICKSMHIDQILISTHSDKTRAKLLRRCTDVLKHICLSIHDIKGFDKAQVTCGGVVLDEIDPHSMESLKISGLYMAGELLDMDAKCGGYNLQWAWATGAIAGIHAADQLMEHSI